MADLPLLRRLHFFAGRLLTADDLEREQEYHRERSRLHNRLLHGWGVADGLDVRSTGGRIRVSPGVAIDQRGEYVIVREECDVAVVASGTAKASCFVVVQYAESAADAVPAATDGTGNGVQVASVIEGAAITISASIPRRPDAGIAIARLIWRQTHWRVDARFRRRTVRH
jgi:hypothetical protein